MWAFFVTSHHNSTMESERRVRCSVGIGDILLIGEQLRIQMHTEVSPLIRDNRHHFKTYPNTFVGSTIVDWLTKTGQAPDRDVAVILMNILLENNVLHHAVYEGQAFKDENSLYRFRKDDCSFPHSEDLVMFLRAKRLYNKLLGERSPNFVRTQVCDGSHHVAAFAGCLLIDWLLNNQEYTQREEATKDMKYLLQSSIIKHVTDSHNFKDEPLLYQFAYNFGRERILMDLVLPPSEVEFESSAGEDSVDNETSVADLTLLSVGGQESSGSDEDSCHTLRPNRTESGYHSDHHDDSSDTPSPGIDYGSPDLFDHRSPPTNSVLSIAQSVLVRKANANELLDPNSQYVRRHIRIASDPVGFGFVIRGEGPVFVKTVDPTGPAAAAGLKVGQYLYKVNEKVVLSMNHQDLAHVILENTGYVSLVVMEHASDCM